VKETEKLQYTLPDFETLGPTQGHFTNGALIHFLSYVLTFVTISFLFYGFLYPSAGRIVKREVCSVSLPTCHLHGVMSFYIVYNILLTTPALNLRWSTSLSAFLSLYCQCIQPAFCRLHVAVYRSASFTTYSFSFFCQGQLQQAVLVNSTHVFVVMYPCVCCHVYHKEVGWPQFVVTDLVSSLCNAGIVASVF
jgi:hypothetical protein